MRLVILLIIIIIIIVDHFNDYAYFILDFVSYLTHLLIRLLGVRDKQNPARGFCLSTGGVLGCLRSEWVNGAVSCYFWVFRGNL